MYSLAFTLTNIVTLSEYRNCSGGTDILLEARDCCNLNYPCNQDEGHCDFDHDCKEGLICGKNNCNTTNFPSKGTRCCTKGGLILRQCIMYLYVITLL